VLCGQLTSRCCCDASAAAGKKIAKLGEIHQATKVHPHVDSVTRCRVLVAPQLPACIPGENTPLYNTRISEEFFSVALGP
jgi:hypothetical protein